MFLAGLPALQQSKLPIVSWFRRLPEAFPAATASAEALARDQTHRGRGGSRARREPGEQAPTSLGAGGGDAALARPPAVQLRLHLLRGELHVAGAAVDDAAHGLAVALAPGGHAEHRPEGAPRAAGHKAAGRPAAQTASGHDPAGEPTDLHVPSRKRGARCDRRARTCCLSKGKTSCIPGTRGSAAWHCLPRWPPCAAGATKEGMVAGGGWSQPRTRIKSRGISAGDCSGQALLRLAHALSHASAGR